MDGIQKKQVFGVILAYVEEEMLRRDIGFSVRPGCIEKKATVN